MMDNDLISRSAATAALLKQPRLTPSVIRRVMLQVPDVDAVEVVRCKDCAVPHNKWTGCPNLNGLVPPPDFYCARGERREDNE